MNLGDLLIPAAAAGFVLIVCALLFMRLQSAPRHAHRDAADVAAQRCPG